MAYIWYREVDNGCPVRWYLGAGKYLLPRYLR